MPTLKLKVLPQFPARVIGGDGISITKVNGVYTIAFDSILFTNLEPLNASSLLGNNAGVAGSGTSISLGATLGFVGAAVQTVAMSGDVTSPANSFVTTISNAAVTFGKFQNLTGSSLFGNNSGSAGPGTNITLGATLNFVGTALQTVALSGDVTTSANSFATTIAANAVTNAKLATAAAYTLKGNFTGSVAVPTDTTISSLADKASPAAGDYVLIVDNAAGGALKRANVSAVGAAGSVSSVNSQTGALRAATRPPGRVTGTSGTAVTDSDVTGATSVYYTPTESDIIELYDGTNWVATAFAELTLALDNDSGHTGYHQSGKNFYLIVFNDGGTVRLGTSPAWATDTTTGTGAGTAESEVYQGRLVNKVSMTVRFGSASGNTATVAVRRGLIVGGFRASANGQTEDSFAKRFISNAQNPTLREMRKLESSATWTYGTAAYRQMNNSAANQVEWFHCVAGRPVVINVHHMMASTVDGAAVAGIGIDSTTTNSATFRSAGIYVAGNTNPLHALYRGNAGLGYHYAAPLEFGLGSGTQTWGGINLVGIAGEVLN